MTTIHKRGSLHEKSARWSHCESLLDDEPDGNDRGKLVAQPLIDYRLYSNMVAQKRVHWKKSLKLFSLVSFFNVPVHGSGVLGGKMRERKSIGMKSEKEMSTVIHKTFVRWIETQWGSVNIYESSYAYMYWKKLALTVNNNNLETWKQFDLKIYLFYLFTGILSTVNNIWSVWHLTDSSHIEQTKLNLF